MSNSNALDDLKMLRAIAKDYDGIAENMIAALKSHSVRDALNGISQFNCSSANL